MTGISQLELDKAFAGEEKGASSGFFIPATPVPGFRKFSALYNKKFPGNPCAITQDELDRILGRGKS
jgi:hypothetical protein